MANGNAEIALTPEPERVALPPGGAAQLTLTVTNRSAAVDRYNLRVEGLDTDWYSVPTPSISLMPSTSGRFVVELQLPTQPPPPAGPVDVRLHVSSSNNPDASAYQPVALSVLPVETFELDLTPRRRRTRGWGVYDVRLSNGGNEARAVDLAVTDPEEALEVRLEEDRVSVAAGDSRAVPVRLRPRRRSLFAPPRLYSFVVTAYPPGPEAADPIASVQGELIYSALLAGIAGLSGPLRALVLGLAGLTVAGVLAIWIFGAPVRKAVATVAAAAGSAIIGGAAAVDEESAQQGLGPNVQLTSPSEGPSPPPVVSPVAPVLTPVPPPVVERFELTLANDPSRRAYELAWAVSGAPQVQIFRVNANGKEPLESQPLPAAGTRSVQPSGELEEFLLEANGAGGPVSTSIGVMVLRPPQIRTLTVDPPAAAPGQAVRLSWDVARAAQITLNGAPVDPSQNGAVVPVPAGPGPAAFVLVASNELGQDQRSVSVALVEPQESVAPTPEAGA